MLALPPRRRVAPAYDPSMYFAHNNFGSPFDAFSNRPKYNDHSVDFTDTLATMISESDARNGTHHYPPQPNPFDPHQFPHASSGHPILSPTGSAFGGFPASAPATAHAPFFESDYAFMRGSAERADTPSLASPTADSPFSQAPPTAPSKRGSGSAASRSRSRGPAAASTSRTRGARKRQSISSPSPPPVANGASAVLIPSQNAWYIPSSDPAFGFSPSLTMPSSIAGASPKSLAKVSMSEDLASKQAQLLSEKRRRRRESHNAVERRRRDNINEKISELSTLIPDCLLTEAPTAAKDDVLGPVDEESTREGPKANKGMILRKSVDYIKYLQQLVRAQASRNRELESQLSHYRGDDASSESPNPSLLPLSSGMDSVPAVDLGNLLPIEDEDSLMTSVALNAELSSQILANIEGASPSEDGDEDEELRGRQAERQRRFASRPSLSLSKSEMVEEVDESALSDGEGSGKMED